MGARSVASHFNSTKVQFGVQYALYRADRVRYFNSTKVQFGVLSVKLERSNDHISIPLRYNLECTPAGPAGPRRLISIPLRYNLEVTIPPTPRPLSTNFNSTKVQFGAVKLDRKYHINKGFEKRFQ